MLCGITGGLQSQEWGTAETLSFQNFPRSGPSPSVEHVQFTCVLNFCLKPCSSRTCPMPKPSPPAEELQEERVCSQKQKTNVLSQGPPLPPTAALPALWQPGMKATPATHAEGPTMRLADPRPYIEGLGCQRTRSRWLAVPGQLFARILDINPS